MSQEHVGRQVIGPRKEPTTTIELNGYKIKTTNSLSLYSQIKSFKDHQKNLVYFLQEIPISIETQEILKRR